MTNYQFPSDYQSWTSIADNGASLLNNSRSWDSGNGYPDNGSVKIALPDSLGNAPSTYYSGCIFYSPGSLGITPGIGNNFSFFYRIENRAAYSQDFRVSVPTPGIGWLDSDQETLTVPASTTTEWKKFSTTFDNTATVNSVALSFANTTGGGDDGYYSVWIDNVYINEADTTLPPGLASELRLIDMIADESKLYATANEAGALKLKVYDLNTFTGDTVTVADGASLGAVTYAQLDAGTYAARPVTLPGKEGRLLVYGRDASDVHVQKSEDFGATLSDIGDGGWDASKVARSFLVEWLNNTDDYVVLFDDDDIYRTEDGGTTWVKMGDGPDAAYGVAARHPIDETNVLIAGTGAGSMDWTNNYGETFFDVADGGIGVINAIEAVQSGSG